MVGASRRDYNDAAYSRMRRRVFSRAGAHIRSQGTRLDRCAQLAGIGMMVMAPPFSITFTLPAP